jgi:hypothetical protein
VFRVVKICEDGCRNRLAYWGWSYLCSTARYGVMAFTESGGRMSIRVTGYDFFFSKSCYICEPISHIILLRAPQCYIFCRTVAFYYYDNSSSPLLVPLPWRRRGGLLLWKGSGSNRGFHRPKRQSSFDRSIDRSTTTRSESS